MASSHWTCEDRTPSRRAIFGGCEVNSQSQLVLITYQASFVEEPSSPTHNHSNSQRNNSPSASHTHSHHCEGHRDPTPTPSGVARLLSQLGSRSSLCTYDCSTLTTDKLRPLRVCRSMEDGNGVKAYDTLHDMELRMCPASHHTYSSCPL